MIRNYFITAWRNLWKNKTFSAINIFGLAFGIGAFLLIISYLRFEYSFDDFHANKDRIFRLPMEISEKGTKEQTFAFTYPAVAPSMKKDFPEVQEAVRMRRRGGVVKQGDLTLLEDGGIYYVDASFFKIFSFAFKDGKPQTALAGLNDLVLTDATAKKYFGNENPMGKALHYDGEDYIVKGVLKDLPANSHLRFNILLNYDKYIQVVKARGGDANGSWNWSDFYTYVLLKPGVNVKELQNKMPAFAERYMGDDMKKTGYQVHFTLQPLKDIHLRSAYDYEMGGNGNMYYLKYLGIAAFIILFIAWINYVNLSTARALDRSKEVGVRKVIGANKIQLIRQFLTESTLINILAIVAGLLIFYISLPWFSNLVHKDLRAVPFSWSTLALLILAMAVSGSLFAGFYPAFVLSGFQPIQTLKSSAHGGSFKGKPFLRQSLVVVQFVAAIVLIAGAIGFYRQLQFMSKRDLGVKIDQTLVLGQTVDQDSTKLPTVESFLNKVQNLPGVTKVTASGDIPGKEVGNSTSFRQLNTEQEKRCRSFAIDVNFISNYGLTLMAGRNFTVNRSGNPLDVILNETAVNVLGFKNADDAIGKQIIGGGDFKCNIIGVLKDYHQESLQYRFDPIIFYPDFLYNMGYYSLRVSTPDVPGLVANIKAEWNKSFPESPFTYYFLDEAFQSQYDNDRLFSTVLLLFTIVAVVVAGLGLFGLSLYTITKKSKEISIRKVLGASLMQIVSLVTRDYLQLVAIAGIIGIPIGYMLLNNWLNDYAFRIDIGWWFFLLPLVLIVAIALLTILYQSIKAAIENPVKSLRTE